MVEPHINRKKRIEESHNLSEKQNVMDDITHGQWSKNYYNEDYDNTITTIYRIMRIC